MKQVARDVFHLPLMPRAGINCYVAEGYLIDAGIRSSAKTIAKNIKGYGVHTHVLTHAHADHQGSSAQICTQLNIPLLCHEKEAHQAATGHATMEYPNQQHIVTSFQKTFWAGGGQNVSGILKEGDRLGGFQVIETPGHSSGHLSYFREQDGVLIAGDVATNMHLLTTIPGLHLPPRLFSLDGEENIRSLKKLASLSPRILCFGHGPVLINTSKTFERFVQKL